MQPKKYLRLAITGLLLHCLHVSLQAQPDTAILRKMDEGILRLMQKGDIPGLSVVLLNNGRETIKSYGYANLENKIPVTPQTNFQIGSCTKAFTALAISKLISEGSLKLTDHVSYYLPWFRVYYEKKPKKITISQLLHHTSGIPWKTISKIPQSNLPDALEKTVKQLQAQQLSHEPGKQYEYATINYDVLALIAQQITGQPFEEYIQQNILQPLGMTNTRMGAPASKEQLATGYKIGYFKPHKYEAPVFRGNNAAGYVYSDITDMGKWLKFQMGLTVPELTALARFTHRRDETVALHGMSAYAMGWHVSLRGDKMIYHDGYNPNYTAYVAFTEGDSSGVAILANANSYYTTVIGDNIMNLLRGEKWIYGFDPGDNNDQVFSIVSGIILLFMLALAGLFGINFFLLSKGRLSFEKINLQKFKSMAVALLLLLPVVYAVYIIPQAFAGFSWSAMMVWAPASFAGMILLLALAAGVSFLLFVFNLFFKDDNRVRRLAPRLLLLSILSGVANMIIIAIITSALHSTIELKYLVFYFALTVAIYLYGRRFVQATLTRLNTSLVYDLRLKLTDKIFSTSFQKFEKIDRGRIYTALNDDVIALADSTNLAVTLVTSVFTTVGAFFYLASFALWATLLTILLILSIATVYFFVTRSTNRYFEEARDTQNIFMRLINGLIDGFKELSLHFRKKMAYKDDIAQTANQYRQKVVTANIRFINAFLVGEFLLIGLLGGVVFALPELFPAMQTQTIMSFVIILLYLIGPVNGILNALPAMLRIRIAWNRIQKFLKDIPANMDLRKVPEPIENKVKSIRVEDLVYSYTTVNDQHPFTVGPVNLEVKTGEILFIIGGNGSGKTTLAKLLTGLYEPDSGKIWINNKVVQSGRLGEYFSVVFSPVYLFRKLYSLPVEQRTAEVKNLLQMLHLGEKVEINENEYSTIDLSGGQRKRMALLQCFLEDAPVYLFDEWAADQDPEYRRFFYRSILPAMKEKGKIIIAITHDDHYFDVADKVLKMNEGKLESYSGKIADPSLIITEI